MNAQDYLAHLRQDATRKIVVRVSMRACLPYLMLVDCGEAGKCVVDWHRGDWREEIAHV